MTGYIQIDAPSIVPVQSALCRTRERQMPVAHLLRESLISICHFPHIVHDLRMQKMIQRAIIPTGEVNMTTNGRYRATIPGQFLDPLALSLAQRRMEGSQAWLVHSIDARAYLNNTSQSTDTRREDSRNKAGNNFPEGSKQAKTCFCGTLSSRISPHRSTQAPFQWGKSPSRTRPRQHLPLVVTSTVSPGAYSF